MVLKKLTNVIPAFLTKKFSTRQIVAIDTKKNKLIKSFDFKEKYKLISKKKQNKIRDIIPPSIAKPKN